MLRIGKKYKFISIILFALITAIFISISYEKFLDRNNLRDLKEFRYDIVDRRAVDEKISKWIDKNVEKSGVYHTSDDEYTYILISSGAQNKEGANITLYSVIQRYGSINVTYSININNDAEIVEGYEKVIILRGPKGDYKINGINKK